MSLEHCLQSTILATAAMLVSDETDEELANLVVGKDIERSRKGSVRRLRQRFLTVTQHLSEEEFKTAFRMTRGTFFLLLSRLRPHLLRNEEMAQRSSGGVVQPEVRLAITLRMLAGGSYIDQMMCWGVGRSMTFRIFLDTIHAIMKEIEMPGLPLGNEVALRDLADGFQTSRPRVNPLYGCVGALDGIAVGIKKPPDEYVPRNFYCRKGMYALPVQAVVDSNLRFRYMSSRCTGSTHDSVAFEVSDLARRLRSGDIISGYWLAGDAAYVSLRGLLTPWSKSRLSGEDGIYADGFNFYHSSHRMHVEQAFGVLVKRWGLLWKPLQYHITEVLPILSAAMRVHNFCIENDGAAYLKQNLNLFEEESQQEAFKEWWRIGVDVRPGGSASRGARRDREENDLRQLLTQSLKDRGITRPALC